MSAKEHVKTAQKARTLLLEAYVEFLDGDDDLKACEKLWQSAAHAITAAAQQRGWECGDDLESLSAAIDRLSEEMKDSSLRSSYSSVEMFRDNIEYGFMEDFQIKGSRPRARQFIERILSLSENTDGDVRD